jgi:hypothetical protein
MRTIDEKISGFIYINPLRRQRVHDHPFVDASNVRVRHYRFRDMAVR